MRVLAKISIPVEAGNAAIKDGSLPKIVTAFMERARPESAYFGVENGMRTAFCVFDLKDASDVPPLFEPFFMGLNARVELTPVMDADDLKAGLQRLT